MLTRCPHCKKKIYTSACWTDIDRKKILFCPACRAKIIKEELEAEGEQMTDCKECVCSSKELFFKAAIKNYDLATQIIEGWRMQKISNNDLVFEM